MSAESEFKRLRATGRAVLPRDPIQARLAAQRMTDRAVRGDLAGDVSDYLSYGSESRAQARSRLGTTGKRLRTLNREMLARSNPDLLAGMDDMHTRRTGSVNTGFGGGSVSDAAIAWPKMRDPFRTFKEKAWFWIDDDFDEALKRLREWCRLIYMTHPLVPSLIDIYSRFPLLDIEFQHQDRKLAEFFEELFMNELNYDEFLFDMAREFWTVGEAFPLGSWHEGIGAWDADELINPDDVIVTRNKALREYEFHIKVPSSIKKLIDSREPREEYETLVRDFPYIIAWAQQDKEIPVSNVLMKQLKFKVSPWNEHGVPILMRAFRTLLHEENLTAAQDAVADRLYSPLILARLGFEADQMGTDEGPWIPDPEELESLRDDLGLTLLADFRMMVYHHGLNIESVFGRENMPRLGDDFNRVDMALMQIFGIGQELLMGGKGNVPYAAGALNRELLTNMLETYQGYVRHFLRDRMEVVAEAQGFYEYERRGTSRIPIPETALMVNEETGEEYLEKRYKLAIPEVNFRSMSMKDETTEREFRLALKQGGVPISDSSMLMNIPIDFEEELEQTSQEKLDKTRAELEFKRQLFIMIYTSMQKGPQFALPVPAEYAAEFDQWLAGMAQIGAPGGVSDVTQPPPTPNVAPTAPGFMPQQGGGGGPAPEEGGEEETGVEQRPDESDEQRKNSWRIAAVKRSIEIAKEQKTQKLAEVEPEPIVEVEPETPSIIDERLDVEEARHEEFSDESIRMGSPQHMRKRKRMTVPKGARIRAESSVQLTPSIEILSDLDEHLRGESDGGLSQDEEHPETPGVDAEGEVSE